MNKKMSEVFRVAASICAARWPVHARAPDRPWFGCGWAIQFALGGDEYVLDPESPAQLFFNKYFKPDIAGLSSAYWWEGGDDVENYNARTIALLLAAELAEEDGQ